MGLKRLVKKTSKFVKRSVKFQAKVALAPLKFAKKNPALTASLVGAAFTGNVAALGNIAKAQLAKKLKLGEDAGADLPSPVGAGEQIGEGSIGGGFGPEPAGFAEEPTQFPPGLSPVLLIAGAAVLVLFLMAGRK